MLKSLGVVVVVGGLKHFSTRLDTPLFNQL